MMKYLELFPVKVVEERLLHSHQRMNVLKGRGEKPI